MAVKEIKITKAGCAGYPVAEMVRGDSNTTLIRMYVDADQDGVDLKGLVWAVDVVNAQGVLDSVKIDTVEVGEMICGEWLVDGMAALDVGRTHFQLEGISDDGRAWLSGKYYIDVGERIDGEAGEGVPERLMPLQELIEYVNDKLPQVLAAGQMAEEAGETAREAYQHPPIIGENGNWYVWDWETAKYTDTGKPSQGTGDSGGATIAGVTSIEGKNGDLTLDDIGAARKMDIDRLSEEIAFNPEDWGVDVLYLNGDTTGMSKDNAKDMAFVWGERNGNVSVKWQGSSSVATGMEIGSKFDTELGGLFNFTLKFEEGFEAKDGWGVQKKYVFKSNTIDHSHSRNLCSGILWGQIVKSRKNVPTELSSLVNGGAVDGFPMIVVLNGKYYAFGTFNIPKDGWMFGSPKAILCADKGMTATAFKALADLQNDFELEYVEDENNADWVLSSLNRAIQAVMDSDGSDLYTTVDQYVDIRSAIDYYIHNVDENGSDAMYKNYILVTFDKVKWYFSAYDRDTTYGLWWNGKGFDSPVGGVTYASYAGTHRLMNLIYRFDNVNLKKRAIELRGGIKSVSNVANVFTNFAAAIPSEVLAHNARRWPLLRSTNASNTAQAVNWYGIRRVAIDAEIESMTGKVEISGNLVPHALAIDSDEVYNGVGYKNNARWANTDQREHAGAGYVAVGRIPCTIYADMIDVTEETYIYIKGDITKPFDDIMDFILYWDASGQLVTFANSNNAKVFYDVVQLGDNYWRMSLKASAEYPEITAISLSRGNDVLRTAYMCISFKGVGEGLTITIGEPIE